MEQESYEKYDDESLYPDKEKPSYIKNSSFDLVYERVLESVKLHNRGDYVIPGYFAVKLGLSKKVVIDVLNKAAKEGFVRGPIEIPKFSEYNRPMHYLIGLTNKERKRIDKFIFLSNGEVINKTDDNRIKYMRDPYVVIRNYVYVGWIKDNWYFVPNDYSEHPYYNIRGKTHRGDRTISKKEIEKRKRKYLSAVEKSNFDGRAYELLYDEENVSKIHNYLSKLKEEKLKKQAKLPDLSSKEKSPIICELCEKEVRVASKNSRRKRKHPKGPCKLEQIRKVMEG